MQSSEGIQNLCCMSMNTVVLIGDVGTGKSTLVEKVTGITGLSSNADASFTRSSYAFLTQRRDLQLIDARGGNSMSDRLEHNVWIAHALNVDPVNLILLVVEAEVRIYDTMDNLHVFADRFQSFDELLAVCVAHMDTVKWGEEHFKRCLQDQLGCESCLLGCEPLVNMSKPTFSSCAVLLRTSQSFQDQRQQL